jgi:hypothetical protein
MLLNEVQKQQRTIQSLQQQSAAVQQENIELKSQLDRLKLSVRQLQRLAGRPAMRKR